MRNFTALLVVFAAACGETDADLTTQNMEDWDHMDLSQFTDLPMVQTDFAADIEIVTPPEWEAVPVQDGMYGAELVEEYSNDCNDGMADSWLVSVADVDGEFKLWGLATLQSNGQALKAEGQVTTVAQDFDCTVTETRFGLGQLMSPTQFSLDVRRFYRFLGTECPVDEGVESCSVSYRARYIYDADAPDPGEGGGGEGEGEGEGGGQGGEGGEGPA